MTQRELNSYVLDQLASLRPAAAAEIQDLKAKLEGELVDDHCESHAELVTSEAAPAPAPKTKAPKTPKTPAASVA